jgi:hypothetical protein
VSLLAIAVGQLMERLDGVALSLASQLPQGLWFGQWEMGWLVDGYREQAHSYIGIGLGQFGIGWLCGRYRWQASSHRDLGLGSERWVGWWIAIASRLAPTVDWGESVWDWLAVRALSLASQLPQDLGLGSGMWVGWSVAIASRLTPTIGLG